MKAYATSDAARAAAISYLATLQIEATDRHFEVHPVDGGYSYLLLTMTRNAESLEQRPANLKRGVVRSKYRDTYVRTKVNGKQTLDCGDDLAVQLRGKDLDAVYALAAETLGVPDAELRKNYAHLNRGLARMTLSVRMRAALRQRNAA